MPKLKNILIFAAIAIVLILIAVFIMNSSSSNQASLVTSNTSLPSTNASTTTDNSISGASASTQIFLNTLLNVKNIKLNVDIFSDPAFTSLHDSSILLVPDATTGRINPFAQFGAGDSAVPNGAAPTTALPTTPATVTPTNPSTGSAGSTATPATTPSTGTSKPSSRP